MSAARLVVLACTLALCRSAAPPSGAAVARQSNVEWADPTWASDGTGAMPIGNGDVASSVWVDQLTGDLRLLLSKSDVFDETSQPVKTGVLRLAFEPALWSRSTAVKEGVSSTACEQSDFCQSLDIATGTITIRTPNVTVSVWVELNAPRRGPQGDRSAGRLRINATGATGSKFGLRVVVEPYRVEGRKSALGAGLCQPGVEHADTVLQHPGSILEDAITWYHYNSLNCSFFNDTIAGQGVDPASHPDLKDPFYQRAWGASVRELSKGSSPQLVAVPSSQGHAIASTEHMSETDLAVTLLTIQTDQMSDSIWAEAIAQYSEGSNASSAPELCANDRKAPSERSSSWQSSCDTTWEEINERSYIQLSSLNSSDPSGQQITEHLAWDRYLALVQGRVAYAAIKFNGQAFNCNNTGKGWDARDWGAGYWWQNTRQPYYNVLAQGDVDTMRSFLDFYLRMLPYVQARTEAQFMGLPDAPALGGGAALYEETCTQFGFYNPNNWGCDSSTPRPHGASANSYIRFHWTGGLELALMVLDLFDAYGDLGDLNKYLPMAASVVEAYHQRFPHKDNVTGKTDMWPSQALETYQCKDPTSRANCPTNSAPDVAGLHAVLPRLISLPPAANASSTQRERWQSQLASLPALPTATAASPTYDSRKVVGYELAKGGLGRSNSENTALYMTHPFRLFGTGKPNLTIAQQTYVERPSPCNQGWCQDVIQAAMLNMTAEAAAQLAERAAQPPAQGFRFGGFAAHYQDYEPSLDHWAFMRTAVNYMLLSPLDGQDRKMLLFPTFDTSRWNVRFKLHAPLNTTVEASCQGGKLEYLIVTPPERRKDIVPMNCLETP